jgi:predicted nucleotide-binding protein (sugar kinase/HSP70/actin superfamily)
VFITNAEKAKLWDNISVLLKKDNSKSAEITSLTQQLKRLEAKLTVDSVEKLLATKKPVKKKTPEQIQKQKEKQREYNRRYAAKKQFEKLERQMAEKAERDQNATSISTASV